MDHSADNSVTSSLIVIMQQAILLQEDVLTYLKHSYSLKSLKENNFEI